MSMGILTVHEIKHMYKSLWNRGSSMQCSQFGKVIKPMTVILGLGMYLSQLLK